jgi:hypothetical protein
MEYVSGVADKAAATLNITSLFLRPRTFSAEGRHVMRPLPNPKAVDTASKASATSGDIGIVVLPQHFATFLGPIPGGVMILLINVSHMSLDAHSGEPKSRATNATGWTFGGDCRRDGGRRMQWLFAHADERAVKLRGAIGID